MKKLLSVLILTSAFLAACSGPDTSKSEGPSKFSQSVDKITISEEDKIPNLTTLAKEFTATYVTLLTDKTLLEGDALDTYLDTHFDVEDKAALKAKAEEYLAQDYETSTTVIATSQTEKDVVKITAKLTFKTGTDSKSSNAYIFARVSDEGNKILEINGHD